MTRSDAERARRMLAAPGAWLDRVGDDWVIRPSADRRRRPVAMLDGQGTLDGLRREPGLSPRAGGGWVLSTSTEAQAPGRLVTPEEGGRLRNRGESPIAWLARRKRRDGHPWLSPAQIMAAERLREDFEAAGVSGRMTMDWAAGPRDRTPRGPVARPPGSAARRRVRAALRDVGPGGREMLEAVCLHGSALQAAERSLGLPGRTGRVVLEQALTRLALHYRLL